MAEKAWIDRLEEGYAVLLVADSGKGANVPRAMLPHGAKEGQWLKVEFEGDGLVRATIDEEETARAKQRIMAKLEVLRQGKRLR